MNKLFAQITITAVSFGLFVPSLIVAQLSPTTPKAARVRIVEGPEVQRVNEALTVIQWTCNNPGGAPEHYGIIHYGTDPRHLDQIARSPIRLNPDHPTTVFRVRVMALKPGRTYYYTVGSTGADGAGDKLTSSVYQFTAH